MNAVSRTVLVVALAAVVLAPVRAEAGPGDLRGAATSCDGVSMGLSSPPPVGTGDCPGVRPGAVLTVGKTFANGGAGCTFAFMFRGSDGGRYMATAGHCVLENAHYGDEHRWAVGAGP